MHQYQDIQHLAEIYFAKPTEKNKERLVVASVPLVRYLIGRLTLPRDVLADHQDLESVGLLGLLEALECYDPTRGVTLVNYACLRIRGAMVDYLRMIDALPRMKRKKLAEAGRVAMSIASENGREPTDAQVATELGMTLPEYHSLLQEAHMRRVLSLDVPIEEGLYLRDCVADERSYTDKVERTQLAERVAALVRCLPERDQTILGLYYYEELTMREIGDIIGVTEARISQVLGKIHLTLRAWLEPVAMPAGQPAQLTVTSKRTTREARVSRTPLAHKGPVFSSGAASRQMLVPG